MSKIDDPNKIAGLPGNTIELLEKPAPLAPPPDPYKIGQERTLGKNETKPDFQTAKVERPKEDMPKPVDDKPKVETQSWVDRIKGTKRAYNDSNGESKGKNLHEIKPAAAAVATNNPTIANVEAKPGKFTDRFKLNQSLPTNKPLGPKK